MSIESPVGTLDIKNATLRVGRLEVSNIQGIDTALNVTRANSVLIYDDQASTTTFTGTTSSAGVRDTVNGYLDVADGYVYWGQKLPNSWVMDFEMDIRSGTNAGSLNLNVFSSINTGSDGYSIVFDDNGDNIILKYDGATIATAAVSGLFTASENWQKVVINYERGMIAISLGGERKLYFQDIERETPYTTGEYINFSSASVDGRKIRDLKITNGSKWIYAGESNVVYTQGSVGVGVTDPTTALDVSGTVKATALEGDGSAITNISSANVGDFASNVTRIETLETDLSSNATRVSTLETDFPSNVTRIGTLETGNMTISGQKTFSGDVIFESNVHMQGDVFVANTVNMTVSDPIIELGSNNLNTGDLGIIMTRHGATNSNIAIVFDESADVLRMGYTLGGASDADITLDSNALAVSVQGALTAASVSGDGSGLSSIQSSNVSDFASNVGRIATLETDLTSNVGRIATLETDLTSNVGRIGTLETDLTSNVTRITNLESSDMTIGGEKTFSSNLQVGTANLFVDTTTSNVGVGTSTPGYALDVVGDINLSGDFYQGGSIFVSSLWTSGNGSLYYDASNVGIGTNTANYELDVVGNVNATTLLANTAQIHSNLTVGSNVTIDDTASNVISVDGNIKADTFNVGDFVVVAAYGLDHVTNENNSTGDTIISTNPITGFRTLSNIVANGNVTATDLLCNTLTMNLVSFTGLQTFDQVTNVGNTTSNTVQFTNTNTSLVTLGNVGIGTANPGALLELSKATGSATISPTELRLSTRTNAADWSVTDPWARLAFYTNDVTGDAPGVMASVGAVASSVNGGENTRLAFFTAEPHVERMCVDRYGNVGIGTASPNTALEVYSTTGTQLTLRSNSRYSTIYGVDDTGSCFFGNDGGQFRITTGGDTSGTGASERMRVDSSGNVGIGTASPLEKLDVYGVGRMSSAYPRLDFFCTTGRTTNDWGNSTGAAGDYRIYSNGDASDGTKRSLNFDYGQNTTHTTRMCINAAGNVGIGTTSPGLPLVLYKNDAIVDFAVRSRPNPATGAWSNNYVNMFCTTSSTGWGGYVQGFHQSGYTHGLALGTITNGSRDDAVMYFRGSNVGIGTVTPYAKLHVYGSGGSISSSTRSYFRYTYTGVTADTAGWGGPGIYSHSSIVTNDYIVSHSGTIGASDTRIKKNIVDADDVECLETLRLLKPKKYQYKDEINRGQEPVWGFIAQEVRDTLPYATQLRRDVLPNIYELANVSQSNVITFVNFNTSNLESNATTLIRTKGIDGEDHDIHLVEVIDEHTIRVEEDLSKWTGSVDTEGNVITEITTTTITPEEYEALEDKTGCVANISGYQNANVVISVEEYNGLEDTTGYEEVIENYTKTATIYPGTQLFVYGQEVDDFIFVKKEAIWTVATAALQEVDRQLQDTKAQLASVLARLDALENP
jgi:hypothetical protein